MKDITKFWDLSLIGTLNKIKSIEEEVKMLNGEHLDGTDSANSTEKLKALGLGLGFLLTWFILGIVFLIIGIACIVNCHDYFKEKDLMWLYVLLIIMLIFFPQLFVWVSIILYFVLCRNSKNKVKSHKK